MSFKIKNRSYSLVQLHSRWWSDDAIARLLGEPDIYSGTHSSADKTIPRWTWDRVIRAEETVDFINMRAAARGPDLTPEERIKRSKQFIDTVEIYMTANPSLEEIIVHLRPTTMSPDIQSFYRPITLVVFNYLRHSCTNYEEVTAIAKREGIMSLVYEDIFRKTVSVVVEAYSGFTELANDVVKRKFKS